MSGARAGRLIGLTCEQRLDCHITTLDAIDETAEERRQRVADGRRERDKLRARRKRAARRVTKPLPLCKTRPWEVLGMSRPTWYRRGKPMPETSETKSAPLLLRKHRP